MKPPPPSESVMKTTRMFGFGLGFGEDECL